MSSRAASRWRISTRGGPHLSALALFSTALYTDGVAVIFKALVHGEPTSNTLKGTNKAEMPQLLNFPAVIDTASRGVAYVGCQVNKCSLVQIRNVAVVNSNSYLWMLILIVILIKLDLNRT